jgi:hypothetical protein
MPDSSGFAAEISDFRLALFDKNGENSEIVFESLIGEQLAGSTDYDVKEMAWSPDSRFLAFITVDKSRPPIPSLYVADTQDQKVIDMCISPGAGLAWSPSSTELALWVSDAGDNAIGVFDFSENQLYVVGYHDGPVIGWRTND